MIKLIFTLCLFAATESASSMRVPEKMQEEAAVAELQPRQLATKNNQADEVANEREADNTADGALRQFLRGSVEDHCKAAQKRCRTEGKRWGWRCTALRERALRQFVIIDKEDVCKEKINWCRSQGKRLGWRCVA